MQHNPWRLFAVVIAVLFASPLWATDVTLRVVDQHGTDIPGAFVLVPGYGEFISGQVANLPSATYTVSVVPGHNNSPANPPIAQLRRTETLVVGGAPFVQNYEWITATFSFSLVDQNNVAIPGSWASLRDGLGLVLEATGQLVTLPITDEAVYPTMAGEAMNGFSATLIPGQTNSPANPPVAELNRISEPFEISAGLSDVRFTWITATFALSLVDQHNAAIPGSWASLRNGLGQALEATGQLVTLPITDESVYPTMAGNAKNGFSATLIPGQTNSPSNPPVAELNRISEPFEITDGLADVRFTWITATFALSLVDQDNIAIPGSWASLRNGLGQALEATGQLVTLPITDESVYPSMAGNAIGGFSATLIPGRFGYTPPVADLNRISPPFEILATTDDVRFEWLMSQCRLSVVGSDEQEISSSSIQVLGNCGGGFPNGSIVRLASTDNSLYPNLLGTFAGGYQIELLPGGASVGVASFEVTGALEFAPSLVNLGGADYGLRCRPPDVTFRVVDQFNTDIPGARVQVPGFGEIANGQAVSLGEGTYNVSVIPGAFPIAQLRRSEVLVVGSDDFTAVFEWKTATFPFNMVDQHGALLPGAQARMDNGLQVWIDPNGSSVTLPILDATQYPTITGVVFDQGYFVEIIPMAVPLAQLRRPERFGVLESTSEVTYEWKTSTFSFTIVDQSEAPIAGSWARLDNGAQVLIEINGQIVTLPVNDRGLYPAMLGVVADNGYFVELVPGRFGCSPPLADLRRSERFPVTESTTAIHYEWLTMDCPLSLVNGSETDVPTSSIVVQGSCGTEIASGNQVALAVTDEILYPSLTGTYLGGYSIELRPGGASVGSAVFEVTGSLEFAPMLVTLGGESYGLRCVPPEGSLEGSVRADCPSPNTPILGVHVDAFEVGTGDLLGSATTNSAGHFEIADLPAGDYTVTIVTPLGYTASSEEIDATVPGGGVATVDFSLSCVEIIANPRSIGYWKHQVGVATGGKGSGQIDGATLCGYLDLIEAHFNTNDLNQVVVYNPPASGACSQKLEVAKDLLNLKGNAGMTARARQQLIALLLNVASGKISLTEVISTDGATVSQAITYSDQLIDSPVGDHETAKTICDDINNSQQVAAGMIPLTTANIAYKVLPRAYSLSQNVPNPFNPSTEFALTLPEATPFRVAIYNVTGQVVKTISGHAEAGAHVVAWDGTNQAGQKVSSGIYFYEVRAGEFRATKKMMLMK